MNLNYNDPLEHTQMNNIGNRGSNDEGVLSGLEVTQHTTLNMSVNVSEGSCFIAGVEQKETSIINVIISASHATLRRKDIIVYDDSDNNPKVIDGTPASTPVPPDFTSDQILLAIVNVGANVTTIINTDIQDSRCYINTIPKNIIGIWSGSESSIPYGWKICDGTNSTPDLRDRFIVGAGTTYAVDSTGGSVEHSHGGGASSPVAVGFATGSNYTDVKNHLPPYYGLCYIMKS